MNNMAARGLFVVLSTLKMEVRTAQHKACVALKTLPTSELRRGAKYFSRRRYFQRFKKENLPNVYSGFVGDTIKQQDYNVLHNLVDEVPDYKEKVLSEARQRRNKYEWKKSMKLINMHQPHSNVQLNDEQITHIKLLHEEDPVEWNKSALAAALNVDISVVALALKRKIQPNSSSSHSETIQPKQFSTQLQPYSPLPTITEQANEREAKPTTNPEKPKTNINPWFKSFETQSTSSLLEPMEELDPDNLEMEESDWSTGDDHADLLYGTSEEADEYEKDEFEEVEELEDHTSTDELSQQDADEVEFEVKTVDGINYYDQNGNFLYRIT